MNLLKLIEDSGRKLPTKESLEYRSDIHPDHHWVYEKAIEDFTKALEGEIVVDVKGLARFLGHELYLHYGFRKNATAKKFTKALTSNLDKFVRVERRLFLMMNEHIPTSEIEKDILDTKREISQLEREVKGYRLIGDKMSMFRADAKASGIKEREAFIHKLEILLNARICDTAPYPSCNGASGCDTCEHQPEE